MTFYSEQITKINKDIYPKGYLTKQVIQGKHFIDNHFADNIDLDLIAGEACISKFHFIRLFKSYYGSTPCRYLASVRIENAKQLLKTNKTIAGVCFSVGFDSITWFAVLFKKKTGLTPGVYKNGNQ